MTEDEIARRLDSIDKTLLDMSTKLGGLADAKHNPGTCSLAGQVDVLRMAEAKRAGMVVIIGSLAGLIVSTTIAFLTRLVK